LAINVRNNYSVTTSGTYWLGLDTYGAGLVQLVRIMATSFEICKLDSNKLQFMLRELRSGGYREEKSISPVGEEIHNDRSSPQTPQHCPHRRCNCLDRLRSSYWCDIEIEAAAHWPTGILPSYRSFYARKESRLMGTSLYNIGAKEETRDGRAEQRPANLDSTVHQGTARQEETTSGE
jgi:hypothetical protein